MMDNKAIELLEQVRQELFIAIDGELERDGHHKSYEGTFAIEYPNRFEEEKSWDVTLDCYVLGPGRHYAWGGDTLMETVEQMAEDVRGFMRGDDSSYLERQRREREEVEEWIKKFDDR